MANVYPLRKPDPATPDEDLVRAALAGETWAQEALFRRYIGVVHGLAFKLIGPVEAKDVAQDAFFLAFSGLDTLREPSSFRSWVCGIVVRVARRRLRRRKLVVRFFQKSDGDAMNEALDRTVPADVAVELKQVYAHIARFPVKLREAFVLTRLEGMTNEETAQAMGVSLTSVKRWLASVAGRLERANQRGTL